MSGPTVGATWVDRGMTAASKAAWAMRMDVHHGELARCVEAALAAVAPLIAAQERERCAALVDCGCAHRADVLTVRNENSGERWRSCGNSPCGALEARAIRALGDAT